MICGTNASNNFSKATASELQIITALLPNTSHAWLYLDIHSALYAASCTYYSRVYHILLIDQCGVPWDGTTSSVEK